MGIQLFNEHLLWARHCVDASLYGILLTSLCALSSILRIMKLRHREAKSMA